MNPNPKPTPNPNPNANPTLNPNPQDTRGRLASQGEFIPFEHERGDGAASVGWVRRQPWCDGRVAVYGPSYLGLTTWACVGGCADGELQAALP